MKIKVKLVFDDWRRFNPASGGQESVYETEEGLELTARDFHHGSSFDAEIEVDEDEAADLAASCASGAIPVFYIPAGPLET